jgi:hypothetical protein
MPNCEVCNDNTVKLDKHHIVSKSLGGSNQKCNIANLCPTCHRKVHTSILVLEGWYLSTTGYVLLYHDKNTKPITDSTPDCFTWG